MKKIKRNVRKKKRTGLNLSLFMSFLKKSEVRWVWFVSCCLMLFCVFKIFDAALFPVNQIQVNGSLDKIQASQIKLLISHDLKGGFFTVNLKKIKKHLQAMAFVDDVQVKKIWPHQLIVAIKEQQLVAKWGDEQLLTDKGKIVYADNIKCSNLPQFKGPEDQAKNMLSFYRESMAVLKNSDLEITEVDLNQRHAWQVVLSDHLTLLLGQKEVGQRMERFLGVLPKLRKIHGENLTTIDLRYPNGVAVRAQN